MESDAIAVTHYKLEFSVGILFTFSNFTWLTNETEILNRHGFQDGVFNCCTPPEDLDKHANARIV
jgi:hypothetical protein